MARYAYAHMNSKIWRTNENSKNPSQRGVNNKNQRAIVSSGIKKPHGGAGYHRIRYGWRSN
jgi:hypothetical protein